MEEDDSFPSVAHKGGMISFLRHPSKALKFEEGEGERPVVYLHFHYYGESSLLLTILPWMGING